MPEELAPRVWCESCVVAIPKDYLVRGGGPPRIYLGRLAVIHPISVSYDYLVLGRRTILPLPAVSLQ